MNTLRLWLHSKDAPRFPYLWTPSGSDYTWRMFPDSHIYQHPLVLTTHKPGCTPIPISMNTLSSWLHTKDAHRFPHLWTPSGSDYTQSFLPDSLSLNSTQSHLSINDSHFSISDSLISWYNLLSPRVPYIGHKYYAACYNLNTCKESICSWSFISILPQSIFINSE